MSSEYIVSLERLIVDALRRAEEGGHRLTHFEIYRNATAMAFCRSCHKGAMVRVYPNEEGRHIVGVDKPCSKAKTEAA